MMGRIFEEFRHEVMQKVGDMLGAGYTLSAQRTDKGNGVTLDGISIKKMGERTSVILYLTDDFESGRSAKETAALIVRTYRENKNRPVIPDGLDRFENVKDRIRFRLIHAASNREKLADIPYIPYLDLAEVFYLDFGSTRDGGLMTALIRNSNMEIWGINVQTLLKAAMENMVKYEPAHIRSMDEIIHGFMCERLGNDYDAEYVDKMLREAGHVPMYVLSNSSGVFGASCLMYPEVLKDFANELQSDLFLIPSSIHECILLKKEEGMSPEELSNMVIDVNQSEVRQEERLSNQVYVFHRGTGTLEIASNAPEYVGAQSDSVYMR